MKPNILRTPIRLNPKVVGILGLTVLALTGCQFVGLAPKSPNALPTPNAAPTPPPNPDDHPCLTGHSYGDGYKEPTTGELIIGIINVNYPLCGRKIDAGSLPMPDAGNAANEWVFTVTNGRGGPDLAARIACQQAMLGLQANTAFWNAATGKFNSSVGLTLIPAAGCSFSPN